MLGTRGNSQAGSNYKDARRTVGLLADKSAGYEAEEQLDQADDYRGQHGNNSDSRLKLVWVDDALTDLGIVGVCR